MQSLHTFSRNNEISSWRHNPNYASYKAKQSQYKNHHILLKLANLNGNQYTDVLNRGIIKIKPLQYKSVRMFDFLKKKRQKAVLGKAFH